MLLAMGSAGQKWTHRVAWMRITYILQYNIINCVAACSVGGCWRVVDSLWNPKKFHTPFNTLIQLCAAASASAIGSWAIGIHRQWNGIICRGIITLSVTLLPVSLTEVYLQWWQLVAHVVCGKLFCWPNQIRKCKFCDIVSQLPPRLIQRCFIVLKLTQNTRAKVCSTKEKVPIRTLFRWHILIGWGLGPPKNVVVKCGRN